MAEIVAGTASAEAIAIIEKTMSSLAAALGNFVGGTIEPAERLFFPHGVELIYFKLNLGKDIDIQIAIAGEKAKYPTGSVAVGSTVAGGSEDVQTLAP